MRRTWVEGTNKMEVSSGFVSSGTLSSAEEEPRGLPLEKRPIISETFGCWSWMKSDERVSGCACIMCGVGVYWLRHSVVVGRGHIFYFYYSNPRKQSSSAQRSCLHPLGRMPHIPRASSF